MKTISSHVTSYMKDRPLLIKYLKRGIINYRALAKYIEPEISKMRGEKVSIGAIAVSLQRLRSSKELREIETVGTLKGTSIHSGLNLVTFSENTKIPTSLLSKEGVLAAVRASNEYSLIVTDNVLKDLGASLSDVGDYGTVTDLAAVGIERTGDHLDIVGGLVYPLNVLLENNIPVLCVVSTENEELILLRDKHTDKASSILRKAMAL